MSLLEAAKALARDEPLEEYSGTYECRYCQAVRIRGWASEPVAEHKPDCPWLQMGAIVAALEAAERDVIFLRSTLNAYGGHQAAHPSGTHAPGCRCLISDERKAAREPLLTAVAFLASVEALEARKGESG